MPDASTCGLFFAVALTLLFVPGPAVLYIVAPRVDQGRLAGLASALGVVKWVGVAYLPWLGLQPLLGCDEEDASLTIELKRLSRIFSQGAIVNVLGSKIALFFLALLPQFVNPSQGVAWTQVAVLLGATFVVFGLCTDGIYALLSGPAGDWLRRRSESARFRRGRGYVSGGVYFAFGASTAVSGLGKD